MRSQGRRIPAPDPRVGLVINTITIALSDERLRRLRELAKEAKVAPEELVRASVDEWLSRPKEDFAQAADFVLRKNAELYRRLVAPPK